MGLLSKLGIGPKEAADAVTGVVNAGADVVERWLPSEKAKHDMALESQTAEARNVQEARAYDPRSNLAGDGLFANIVNTINVVVDAANRLVRPTLAFTCMGTLFGWWDVVLNTKDPLMTELSIWVFGFYFGVRGLTEDLPKVLRALKEYRRGKGQ